MRKIMVLSCLLLIVSLLASCGEKTETTRYYYSPSWVRNGKIILVGATESVGKDILGSQMSSSYTEYVLTMYPSGTGESSALFDVTDAPPYAMSCSPTTDYVAYMDDLRSGLFRKIVIRNISEGQHLGLEKVEIIFSPGIKSFDWSSNGTELVYCTTGEVRTIDVDGSNDTLVVADTNLEFVTWKYGGRIAFVRKSGSDKLLSLINQNGTNRFDFPASASVDLPQISSSDTNIIYGVAGGSYVYVNRNDTAAGRTTVKTSFTGVLPRLSPDAKKATYSKSGEKSGIYVLSVSGVAIGTETKIR